MRHGESSMHAGEAVAAPSGVTGGREPTRGAVVTEHRVMEVLTGFFMRQAWLVCTYFIK